MLDITTLTNEEEDILAYSASNLDWTEIVGNLIQEYTKIGKPFSSGELAAKLRTYRTDLKFSAFNLGEFVRDAFSNSEYNLDRFMKFSRYTRSGQLVFVYAPNKWTGDSYDFEVDIPAAPSQQTHNTPPATVPFWNKGSAPILPQQPQSTIVTTGPQDNVEVRLSKDGRLCFGKGLVEKIIKETQKNFMPGGPLYFIRDNSCVLGVKFVNFYNALALQIQIQTKSLEADGRVRIKFEGSPALNGTVFTVPFKTLIEQ